MAVRSGLQGRPFGRAIAASAAAMKDRSCIYSFLTGSEVCVSTAETGEHIDGG
jgi:hypothetical protein